MPKNHHNKIIYPRRNIMLPTPFLLPYPYPIIPELRPIRVIPINKPRNPIFIDNLKKIINDDTELISEVGVIYYNKKGILLIKNSNDEWSIPLNSKESTESVDSAYVRIFKEKTKIILDSYNIINNKKYKYRRSNGNYIMIFSIMTNEYITENDNLKFISYEDLKKIINNNETINKVSKLTEITIKLINKIEIK